MNTPEHLLYDELAFYTLGRQDANFIHQHIVDAYFAQTANENTKPITLLFSLVGLFLYAERNYTGKEVQRFHQKMAENKQVWPFIQLPGNRGDIRVGDVVAMPPGSARDKRIKDWCMSVWKAYESSSKIIRELAAHYSGD